jgi:ParB-like chromosome segregation protein Spo0J
MRFGKNKNSKTSTNGRKVRHQTNARRPKGRSRASTGSLRSAPQNIISKIAQAVIRDIEIGRIKVNKGRRRLNPAKLRLLVSSLQRLGLQHEVTVRQQGFGPIYLVAGLHRLEAAKQLKWAKIRCKFLQGDENEARLWEIAENLHRAELTPLEESRLIAEWVRLTEAENSNSGEKAKKIGRPAGGIAKAARELPVKGETEEARRKTVERALKGDRLLPKAEKAAKAAGFDKNQSLLLKIAEEKTLPAQLKKIADLVEDRRKAKAKRKAGAGKEVSFDSLKTEWMEGGKLRRSAWERAGKAVRNRFVDKVLRASAEQEDAED